jgi:DNA-directed RNA polymerase specialized sigma24 family protein
MQVENIDSRVSSSSCSEKNYFFSSLLCREQLENANDILDSLSLEERTEWLSMGWIGACILLVKKGDSESFDLIESLPAVQARLRSCMRGIFIKGADSSDLMFEARYFLWEAICNFKVGSNPNKLDERESFFAFISVCTRRSLLSCVTTAASAKHSLITNAISLDSPINDEQTDDLYELVGNNGNFFDELFDPEREFVRAILEEDLTKLTVRFGLTEKQAKATFLVSEGSTYRQAAKIIGCKAKDIDNAFQKAKTKLRTGWKRKQKKAKPPKKIRVRRPIELCPLSDWEKLIYSRISEGKKSLELAEEYGKSNYSIKNALKRARIKIVAQGLNG